MKISEVSKKIDLPVATIRYYSDLNMIPSLQRDSEGQRIFDDEAVVWLQGIKFLRELNIPIADIKEYIELSQKTGPAALKKRHQMLLKQRAIAQHSLAHSTERLDKIDKKIKHEEEIINGRKHDSLNPARRFIT